MKLLSAQSATVVVHPAMSESLENAASMANPETLNAPVRIQPVRVVKMSWVTLFTAPPRTSSRMPRPGNARMSCLIGCVLGL